MTKQITCPTSLRVPRHISTFTAFCSKLLSVPFLIPAYLVDRTDFGLKVLWVGWCLPPSSLFLVLNLRVAFLRISCMLIVFASYLPLLSLFQHFLCLPILQIHDLFFNYYCYIYQLPLLFSSHLWCPLVPCADLRDSCLTSTYMRE